MAAAESRTLLDELRDLVAKSIEANSRLILNGAEFLRRASDQKADIAQLAADGGEVLNSALRDYVRLSATHTSRLIDLSLEVSDRLVGRAGAAPSSGPRPSAPQFDIRLSGAAGATCQTAFAIDNDHSEPVAVGFEYGLMVDEKGETATDVEIRFDPPEATIPRGGQGRFVLSLTIPRDMSPGLHHTLISIRGLPRLGFRLLLQVEKAKGSTRKAAGGKAVAKKTAAKRARTQTADRKTAAKKPAAAKAASKRPAAGKKATAKRAPSKAAAGKATAEKPAAAKKARPKRPAAKKAAAKMRPKKKAGRRGKGPAG